MNLVNQATLLRHSRKPVKSEALKYLPVGTNCAGAKKRLVLALQLNPAYSNTVISNSPFFELRNVSIGFAFQSFTIGSFGLWLFPTIFPLP